MNIVLCYLVIIEVIEVVFPLPNQENLPHFENLQYLRLNSMAEQVKVRN